MNTLQGKIRSIKVLGSIHEVHVTVGSSILTALLMDTDKGSPFIKVGNTVSVLFKEIDIIIARAEEYLITIQNQIPCKLVQLEKGSLFSKLSLQNQDMNILAITSTATIERLGFQIGSSLIAMIKANDIILVE